MTISFNPDSSKKPAKDAIRNTTEDITSGETAAEKNESIFTKYASEKEPTAKANGTDHSKDTAFDMRSADDFYKQEMKPMPMPNKTVKFTPVPPEDTAKQRKMERDFYGLGDNQNPAKKPIP